MSLVVDVSVAVKWLIAEEDSDEAQSVAAGGDDLHVPRLMAVRSCQARCGEKPGSARSKSDGSGR